MANKDQDFSEYKASDREIYYAKRRGDNNISYDYFNNEVRFITDTKVMYLRVDNGKEDFAMCDIMEESDEQHGHKKPDILTEEEILEYAENDKEIADKNAEWVKYFEEKYKIDYEKQTYFCRVDSDSDSQKVPLPINNVLCGCNIRLNIGEGILDFIYADFLTPYKKGYYSAMLPEMLAELSSREKESSVENTGNFETEESEPYKVLSEADLIYHKYLCYKTTASMVNEISYASLYTAICPPVFEEKNEHKAYKIYFSYLNMLQKEFLELIEFCFDDEFYPEIFGKYQPHERFCIYTYLTDRPVKFYREETFMTSSRTAYSAYLKEGLDEKEIIKRLTVKIETTPGLVELSKKYDIEEEELKTIIKLPKFVDKYYHFSTVSEILELEFTKMLEMDIRYRKCKRCGKYFIVKGNYGTQYCDRVEEGKTQSCQKLAALEKYKKENADNEAKKIYDKYYKRYSARLKVNQIKPGPFKKWQMEALAKRLECETGKISPEEYIAWNESAFPNRKPKNK